MFWQFKAQAQRRGSSENSHTMMMPKQKAICHYDII